jgi:hypothetical protein
MRRYIVNPAVVNNQITPVEVTLENIGDPDYVHAITHGYIWESYDEARVALHHMLDFGKTIVEINERVKKEVRDEMA